MSVGAIPLGSLIRHISHQLYVPECTETEKQRKHYYVMDLSQALQSILVAHNCPTLKKLVNTTALIEMDHKQNALEKGAFHNEERQRP